MLIKDIFETRIEETIEPVIKVGERENEKKLASEIGSYVVTPTIERYIDDFLEHYTDTLRTKTTEIGVWISGYFGSGKSHLAKIISLLIENRQLDGISVSERFKPRIPPQVTRRDSIIRSMTLLDKCRTKVLAFNINTLADSKETPLPRILLSQYYQSKGYSPNIIYAKVIESELDKLGKLDDLHKAVERLSGKKWDDIRSNPTFYSKALYKAACEVAPEQFASESDVRDALEKTGGGELFNVEFLVQTIIEDLKREEKDTGTPFRLVLVLDESGQWIEDNANRLSQMQAFVEEAAIKGQGKIWVFVTTHEDLGSIYENAKALKEEMKKIEGRFRFKFSLTTENIELVLEDRIFKKKLAGREAVKDAYNSNPGILRDLGELRNSLQKLPECNEDKFTTFYPFFPYQIHLIPDVVKSLRSAGGMGEQLSGSTRTLLAITQDILRAGRRSYLEESVGEMVSFDEVFNNLAGEGEVNPDVRTELKKIENIVPDANELTRRVAEVIYLIQELAYIPRTMENLARLLVESTSDDLTARINAIQPELDKLMKAKLVAKIGEEYEYLTGEKRTFEGEVAEEKAHLKHPDREAGLAKLAGTDLLGFSTVPFKGRDFPARISFDGNVLSKDGHISVEIISPLQAHVRYQITDIENRSLQPDEQLTIFVMCGRVSNFEENLNYYIATKSVIDAWKGDPSKSEEAHKLAAERESKDLDRMRRRIVEDIREGIKNAHVVFRGSSRSLVIKSGKSPGEALRDELATYWPSLYPKYEKVPVRLANEQKAIVDMLKGEKSLPPEASELKLFDGAGQLDMHCPLLEDIRLFISTRQSVSDKTLGKDIITQFIRPPYGWEPGVIRLGVAALVRNGNLRIIIDKKAFSNPLDGELQDSIRVTNKFDKVELVLEDIEIETDVLTEVRKLLMKLASKKKIDETPAALSQEMEELGRTVLEKAQYVENWAEPAKLPLPDEFEEAVEALRGIDEIANPVLRVKEIHEQAKTLGERINLIRTLHAFIKKWGKAFTGMGDFVVTLKTVEYRLPEDSSCKAFLDNWRFAIQSANITDDAVWIELQTSKAAADLELEKLKSEWKEEAKGIAEEALQKLPQDISSVGLPAGELEEKLSAPLRSFLTDMEEEQDAGKVASLTSQVRIKVSSLDEALRQEVQKLIPKPKPGGEEKKPKPIKRIAISAVTQSPRIKTEEEWGKAREALDAAVKKELAAGNEVELSP